MSSEVICALIGAASTILSALIAFLVSRYTTAREFKKLKLTWQREDSVSYEEDYESMVAAVTQYIKRGSDTAWYAALDTIAILRSKATGEMAEAIDTLNHAVSKRNWKESEASLTKVIEKKRQVQREGDACLRKKKMK